MLEPAQPGLFFWLASVKRTINFGKKHLLQLDHPQDLP